MQRLVVIGGGVAGCATAAAIAAAGGAVTLLEARHHLGGVAAMGEHATLCGLAPIDAREPVLLEAGLVAGWLPYLATALPRRQGRVWLWPTSGATLTQGLARRLADLGVEVRLGTRVTAIACRDDANAAGRRRIASLTLAGPSAAEELEVAGVVDASGQGISAAALMLPLSAAVQWPAYRCIVRLPSASGAAGRSARLAQLRAAQQASGGAAALALTALPGGDCWQLSLDVAPLTSCAVAAQAAGRVAEALGGELIACAISVAERDHGRPAGTLTLSELFGTRSRGLCWAAWPCEDHRAEGVQWTWPEGDRHGIPEAVVRLPGGPDNLWLVGKGMAVSQQAAAALRVTGTCLALGGAVAALARRWQQVPIA
jgi:hypothetical protein